MTKQLPKRLPTTAPSVLGPIAVTRVANLRDSDGTALLGVWRSATRQIDVLADAAPVAAWHTYWHEHAHAVLYDAGVALGKKKCEAVCDAFATARVREMLDGTRP